MIMASWIHNHFQTHPPEGMGGPVPYEEIEAAERELGIQLPDDYKEYLHCYGSGGTPMYQILGLRTAPFQPDTEQTFVEATNEMRPELPEEFREMVVICFDYGFNPVGFLPDDPTIFVIDHHMNNKKITLAKNFEEFVSKLITEEGFEGR